MRATLRFQMTIFRTIASLLLTGPIEHLIEMTCLLKCVQVVKTSHMRGADENLWHRAPASSACERKCGCAIALDADFREHYALTA
jgi:hypothetical protein